MRRDPVQYVPVGDALITIVGANAPRSKEYTLVVAQLLLEEVWFLLTTEAFLQTVSIPLFTGTEFMECVGEVVDDGLF